ncbi:MAG TPA: hypothetical protein VGB37_14790 [Candidatus Lokiarchaeia archaeon]
MKLNSNELHFVRHNISLKTTPSAPSKLPTATSLNNNIMFNLRGRLQRCETTKSRETNRKK